MEIDGIFARGRTAAEARRIGEGGGAACRVRRRARGPCGRPTPLQILPHNAGPRQDLLGNGQRRGHTATRAHGPRSVLRRGHGRGIAGRPLPAPVRGGGPRASGAGRRAKHRPFRVVLLCLRCADRHDAARCRRLVRPGRKTVGRCVGPAKALLAAAVAVLPTPRACEERLRGLADPREIKAHLPGPGRGACNGTAR